MYTRAIIWALLRSVALLLVVLIAGPSADLYAQSGMGLHVGGVDSGPMVTNPSAIFWNPAAMIKAPRKQMLLDIGTIVGKGSYQRAPDALSDFYPAVDASSAFPVPFAGYLDDFGLQRWRFGIATSVPFGSGGQWDEQGPQKYHLIRGFEGSLYLTAAAAFAVTPKISMGLGVSYVFSMLKGKVALDLAPRLFGLVPPSFGGLTSESPLFTAVASTGFMTSHSIGANGGIFFQPMDDLDIGVGFHLPVTVKSSGPVDVTLPDVASLGQPVLAFLGFDGSTLKAQGRITTKRPAFISAGFSYRHDPRWTSQLMGTFFLSGLNDSFTSELFGTGFPFLDSPEGTSVRSTGARNTFHVKGGIKHQISRQLLLGGYLFFSRSSISKDFVNASGIDFSLIVPTWMMQYSFPRDNVFGLSISPIFPLSRSVTNSVFDPTAPAASGFGLPQANGFYQGIGLQVGLSFSKTF